MGVFKKTVLAAALSVAALGAGMTAANASGPASGGAYVAVAYDGRGYDRGYDRGGRYDDRGRYDRDRVVKRRTFDTRWRARIHLVEEVSWSRRGGRDLVCTVSVSGPDARRVRDRDVRQIAHRHCSRGAQIRVYA